MKRELINLTPHSVNVLGGDNEVIHTIEPYGVCWRVDNPVVKFGDWVIGDKGSVPLNIEGEGTFNFGGVEPEEGGHYIVSRPMAQALVAAGKPGVFYVPGEQVRDEAGRVLGCKSFVLFTSKD